MNDQVANSDPSTWDPALDAVVAAPKHHKVLFENENLRVIEVTLEHEDEEPVHHHRWPSVFVFDQIQGPVHDIAPDGTPLPPNRDLMQAIQAWDGKAASSPTWRPSRPDGSSTPPARPSTASASR
jgi:hypothetical protein